MGKIKTIYTQKHRFYATVMVVVVVLADLVESLNKDNSQSKQGKTKWERNSTANKNLAKRKHRNVRFLYLVTSHNIHLFLNGVLSESAASVSALIYIGVFRQQWGNHWKKKNTMGKKCKWKLGKREWERERERCLLYISVLIESVHSGFIYWNRYSTFCLYAYVYMLFIASLCNYICLLRVHICSERIFRARIEKWEIGNVISNVEN